MIPLIPNFSLQSMVVFEKDNMCNSFHFEDPKIDFYVLNNNCKHINIKAKIIMNHYISSTLWKSSYKCPETDQTELLLLCQCTAACEQWTSITNAKSKHFSSIRLDPPLTPSPLNSHLHNYIFPLLFLYPFFSTPTRYLQRTQFNYNYSISIPS